MRDPGLPLAGLPVPAALAELMGAQHPALHALGTFGQTDSSQPDPPIVRDRSDSNPMFGLVTESVTAQQGAPDGPLMFESLPSSSGCHALLDRFEVAKLVRRLALDIDEWNQIQQDLKRLFFARPDPPARFVLRIRALNRC